MQSAPIEFKFWFAFASQIDDHLLGQSMFDRDQQSGDIPISLPDLTDLERANATQVLATGDIGPSGRFRDHFEAAWAARNGVARAITFSSGTTSLHAALVALGIGAGDEVIVPAMTYVASANAVLHAGARPVFVDVDPDTFCLDPEAVAAAITPRTRALMPVHLFGHPCPMAALGDIARTSGLALVADAAHAPLAGYRGRPVAAAATVTVHSFFLNKTFTAGEGGALLTQDPDLITAALQLRAHGLSLDGRNIYNRLGYNYRLTNLACAILCGQEKRAEEILSRCAAINRCYREGLQEARGLRIQAIRSDVQPVQWCFPVVLPSGCSPEVMIHRLQARGIGSRPFFPTPDRIAHLAPFHTERPHSIANSRRLAERGLLLPLRSNMTIRDVECVIEAVSAELDWFDRHPSGLKPVAM